MKYAAMDRRQFIRTSALVGAAIASPLALDTTFAAATTTKRTATDQVTLGKTGIKLSRLGIGTGVNNGGDQVKLGKDEFVRMVRHAYDQGITYIDCAQRYQTFGWIADCIKGLPREKLFIQSKVPDKPEDVLAVIDRHRKTFNTDYIDSLLIHCMTEGGWTDSFKRVMDGFNEAKEKKWIRAKGVSCHTLPALQSAVASDWTEVHLVRVNPQGHHMDGATPAWGENAYAAVDPVLEQIKMMHDKGHGIIGMKIFGNGDFTNPADREKSIRFAMSHKEIDAVVIGFTAPKEIDEAIERINRALVEG
jgi:predicted aldo/keto reductase-like oxidoreductase